LLEVVDGVLLTGARPNVHPTHFGAEPHPARMNCTTKGATRWPWR
jgi:gamma-glutamyl-gamma-aminobutyrate hydrolase PuuD